MSRLFVRNLTVIDFAYLHPARGLLGESWRVHVELAGELDPQGMVLDFAEVKRGVKRTLDEHFDHRLLVPAQHPGLNLEQDAERVKLVFPLADGQVIRHGSPRAALTLIPAPLVDEASVMAAAHALLLPLVPENVTELTLQLEPEAIQGAYFHYAHGLKRHCGNCQRIAHGHRSRIEIYRDGVRDAALEADWARRWGDIYIATREDLKESGSRHLHFAYRSAQGAFDLEVPAARCYLVDSDSTIENLAQHVADTLAAEHPRVTIRARVFEGIDKGAIGEARYERDRTESLGTRS
jgi:6-pyruvoyl-tetrahydropterin synthase